MLRTVTNQSKFMRTVTPPPDAPQPSSFSFAFLQLVLHPGKVIRLWNWKAALLSVFLRGPIFFSASFRQGLGAAVSALLTESFFCAATAGFYGAIVQSLRSAQPQWMTLLFITVILPAGFQSFEFLLHWVRGTSHLRIAEFVSIFVSGFSALFNWYIMRRNTLLVGPEGGRFKTDLARLPRLFLGFITALPRRWLDRRKRENFRCMENNVPGG
jgi:hypothetical protein